MDRLEGRREDGEAGGQAGGRLERWEVRGGEAGGRGGGGQGGDRTEREPCERKEEGRCLQLHGPVPLSL